MVVMSLGPSFGLVNKQGSVGDAFGARFVWCSPVATYGGNWANWMYRNLSMLSYIKERTELEVRPWTQGFLTAEKTSVCVCVYLDVSQLSPPNIDGITLCSVLYLVSSIQHDVFEIQPYGFRWCNPFIVWRYLSSVIHFTVCVQSRLSLSVCC
jgi:hypothetical protein